MKNRLIGGILTAALLVSMLTCGASALEGSAGESVFEPVKLYTESEMALLTERPEPEEAQGVLENATFAAVAEEKYGGFPNTHVNTGNQQFDIVEIAKTQVGYREVGDNHTKYNLWYAYGQDVQFEWCGIFISWCANQAGIPSSILKPTGLATGNVANMQHNTYGCPAYAFQGTVPQPGDIAYIAGDGGSESTHVGLVVAVDDRFIYTVEGNSSNAVSERQYTRSTGNMGTTTYVDTAKILFFARPNYQGTDIPTGGQMGGGADEIEHIDGFEDVPVDSYYAEPVIWALENEITNGIGDSLFAPSMVCTRAQVVTFLWRAAGSPEPVLNFNPFEDVVEDSYYYTAVCWAVENGITSGVGDDLFAPNNPCTRAQVVTFLWRAHGRENMDFQADFSDVERGTYYTEPVAWAMSRQITNGIGENLFAPNMECSRGQIVTFLYRAR